MILTEYKKRRIREEKREIEEEKERRHLAAEQMIKEAHMFGPYNGFDCEDEI